MQLYKEVLLAQDQRRSYLQAVEQDRLVRLSIRRQRSLQSVSRVLARLVGLFFSL